MRAALSRFNGEKRDESRATPEHTRFLHRTLSFPHQRTQYAQQNRKSCHLQTMNSNKRPQTIKAVRNPQRTPGQCFGRLRRTTARNKERCVAFAAKVLGCFYLSSTARNAIRLCAGSVTVCVVGMPAPCFQRDFGGVYPFAMRVLWNLLPF